jgi:hypothetical protein
MFLSMSMSMSLSMSLDYNPVVTVPTPSPTVRITQPPISQATTDATPASSAPVTLPPAASSLADENVAAQCEGDAQTVSVLLEVETAIGKDDFTDDLKNALRAALENTYSFCGTRRLSGRSLEDAFIGDFSIVGLTGDGKDFKRLRMRDQAHMTTPPRRLISVLFNSRVMHCTIKSRKRMPRCECRFRRLWRRNRYTRHSRRVERVFF